MKKIYFTVFSALLMSACTSRGFNGSEVEMTSNTPDDGAHPEVGYSVDGDDTHIASKEACTVTLIRRNYVVTASHCVGEAGPQKGGPLIFINNHTYRAVATNSPQTVSSMRFCFDKKGVQGSDCQRTAVGLDFAVMKLDRAADVSPATVGTGTPSNVAIYGYGCKNVDTNQGRGQGRMYRGPWNNGKLLLTCTGDSGGPVFDTSSGKLVRTMSQGLLDHGGDPNVKDAFANVGAVNSATGHLWVDDLIAQLGN